MVNLIAERKLQIVTETLKKFQYEDKKKYIICNLKEISMHQSCWFFRKFSSIIPKSLEILISDLTKTKLINKEIAESDYNKTLIEVCEDYFKISSDKNDVEIKNIYHQTKKTSLINKNDNITSSFYTKYGEKIKELDKNGKLFFFGDNPNKDIIKYPNGDIYEGEFKDNEPHGKGILTYINGDIYKGELRNGKPHGKGKLTNSIKNVYKGEFKNGELYKGKLVFNIVDVYKGKFKGNVYEGEFKDGKPCGIGKLTYYNSRDILEGKFNQDLMLGGEGKMTFGSSGNIYEGEFKHNMPEGEGKLSYSNGNIHEGKFRDGKPHGIGKLIYKNGGIREGEFRDSKLAY